jgi:hypothetical protein
MDMGTGDSGSYHRGQPGGLMVGIDFLVLATVFTLIVLLTGGPSNRF